MIDRLMKHLNIDKAIFYSFSSGGMNLISMAYYFPQRVAGFVQFASQSYPAAFNHTFKNMRTQDSWYYDIDDYNDEEVRKEIVGKVGHEFF